MKRRLATMFLTTMSLVGVSSPSVPAQSNDFSVLTLKGIGSVMVVIDDLPNKGADILGLTRDAVQTDVELKLRVSGIHVVTTMEELYKVPGAPILLVQVNIANDAEAVNMQVELRQNTSLVRNGQPAFSASTWRIELLQTHTTAQDVRNGIKDYVDRFLNAWLSVNPNKSKLSVHDLYFDVRRQRLGAARVKIQDGDASSGIRGHRSHWENMKPVRSIRSSQGDSFVLLDLEQTNQVSVSVPKFNRQRQLEARTCAGV